MSKKHSATIMILIPALFLLSGILSAQAAQSDYERALKLREELQSKTLNIVDRTGWIEETGRFWYRKSVEEGTVYFIGDPANKQKKAAFDHIKLASALSRELESKIDPWSLPFRSIKFLEQEKSIEFETGGRKYQCDLTTYEIKQTGPGGRYSRGGFSMWEWGPGPEPVSKTAEASPDGKWEAFIKNYNVWIRPAGEKNSNNEIALSRDGSEGNYYTFDSLVWSPDSKRIAVFRLRRGYHRLVRYVESSPEDQLQPKYHEMEYAKPGDALDIDQPVLFDVESQRKIEIENNLFPNPYDLGDLEWRKDSRTFTFEYNQRGHQVYRIIEVDAVTGRTRPVISEESGTFFHYSGKKYRFDLADGKEIIWMSERDGWNHLYLYDGTKGQVKNQITRGEWVVRGVDKVDEANRQIYFRTSGMYPEQDPYFIYGFRIDFDGSNLMTMTEGKGTHNISYSPDMAFLIDTWSRGDKPPITELRRTSDRKLIMEVEKADISRLLAAGWKPPEVFVSKGRDGLTDIWGIICRPMNFDPAKRYPVVEYIYAGPHSSFVPKTFSACHHFQPLAELGFIVVQIDGMGTSNRSKAFHDVCWKNLGDAGFPDRILWHKAVADHYPYYDISRVGIYGNSAGGQNSLGGMLNHPEFYKVCVSSCGCHDNRMDKIWWNEQWMGWPVGPEYAAASNTENAHQLQGRLLLILGEMDTNVDPASTMQVVNALIKADKVFDLLVIPGGGHGMGGAYGRRKMMDFFVRHLVGGEPPDWNRLGAGKNEK